MFTPKGFPWPISSFEEPVPLPTTHPNDDPRAALCINEDWLPYLRGAAKQLLLESTWATTDPTALANVTQDALELIGLLQDNVAICTCVPTFQRWHATSTVSGLNLYVIQPGGATPLPTYLNTFDEPHLHRDFWEFTAWTVPLFGTASYNLTLIGQDEHGVSAGPNLYFLDVANLEVLGALLSVQVLDCTGTAHSVTQTTPVTLGNFGFSDEFEGIQEIVIGSSAPFIVHLAWKDLMCGGA